MIVIGFKSEARKFDSLDYKDIINMNLKVMDSTAASLCMDNDIPIIVFGLDEPITLSRL